MDIQVQDGCKSVQIIAGKQKDLIQYKNYNRCAMNTDKVVILNTAQNKHNTVHIWNQFDTEYMYPAITVLYIFYNLIR